VGEDRCHPDWRIGRGSIAKHARLFIAGVVVGAALTFLVSRTDLLLPFFIVLGLVAGLPGAAVMSLPPRVLSEEARAIGMGIFSTAHYCVMLLLPPLQGSGLRNDTAATFDFAGIFLLSPPRRARAACVLQARRAPIHPGRVYPECLE
jgi:hypothetical protein